MYYLLCWMIFFDRLRFVRDSFRFEMNRFRLVVNRFRTIGNGFWLMMDWLWCCMVRLHGLWLIWGRLWFVRSRGGFMVWFWGGFGFRAVVNRLWGWFGPWDIWGWGSRNRFVVNLGRFRIIQTWLRRMMNRFRWSRFVSNRL